MESKSEQEKTMGLDEFGISVDKQDGIKKLIDPFSESHFVIVSQDYSPLSPRSYRKSTKQIIYVI